jgi:hypothetical protein
MTPFTKIIETQRTQVLLGTPKQTKDGPWWETPVFIHWLCVSQSSQLCSLVLVIF